MHIIELMLLSSNESYSIGSKRIEAARDPSKSKLMQLSSSFKGASSGLNILTMVKVLELLEVSVLGLSLLNIISFWTELFSSERYDYDSVALIMAFN